MPIMVAGKKNFPDMQTVLYIRSIVVRTFYMERCHIADNALQRAR